MGQSRCFLWLSPQEKRACFGVLVLMIAIILFHSDINHHHNAIKGITTKMSQVQSHLKTGGETLEFQSKIEVTNKISAQCQDRFQELKLRRKHRFIIYKMGDEEIEVEQVGARSETYEHLKKTLPYSECRYAVYDQDYKTSDGRPASKLWFVSWFPNSSTTHMKMAYAAAKGKFRETLLGVFDTQVSSMEELDASLGLGDREEEEEEGFDF